jgi:hypothetical protein
MLSARPTGGYTTEERRVPGELMLTPYNSVMRQIHPPAVAALALVTTGLVLLVMVFRNNGNLLVVDNREKSDAILITQGDSLDESYWIALRLLTDDYGRELLLDARTNRIFFGRTQAEWAGDFITKTAANLPGRVKVCPISADTTAQEVYEAGNCLKGHSIHSVLLVVADFHTRRSLAIFSRLLPQYRWSVAAVQDPMRFGAPWWQKREWIRTAIIEWQHLLWWEMIDRWRFVPQTSQSVVQPAAWHRFLSGRSIDQARDCRVITL